MRLIPIVLVLISCDATVDLAPDAGAASLEVIWDPRVCGREPRGRVEVRLVDSAGAIVLADAACIACSIDATVPHVGWYWATAIAIDDDRGGRELAAAMIAVDGPSVRWRIRAW